MSGLLEIQRAGGARSKKWVFKVKAQTKQRVAGFLRRIEIWVGIGSVEEGLARRVLSASQQNHGVMRSAEAWSNGLEIPTKDLLCIDGGGLLVGCFSEYVQAGLVLLTLDQALML